VKDTLARLAAVWGPPGDESETAREIRALIGPSVDETRTDALGNLIATVRGGSAPAGRVVMVLAHMDQPGLIITEIDKNGLGRFGVLGCLEPASLPGLRVRSRNGTLGVVALEEGVEPKDLAPGKMVVDFGSAAPAAGDILVPAVDFAELGGRFSAPALDDRTGCAVLIEVARRLKADGEPRGSVHFVFTVQGAVAPRGARPAAAGLEPDLGLVVDLTPARAAGQPRTEVELGKGPAVRLKEPNYVAPPEVTDLLRRAARTAGVPWQTDIGPSVKPSDAQAVELAGAGVPTGVLGLPARYARTPSPVVDPADLEGAVRLLTVLLARELD